MLHKFRKFYYDNKTKIWRVILIIASIFIIIQLANYLIQIRTENVMNNVGSQNLNTTNSIINSDNTNTYVTSNTSGVSGELIDENILKKASEIIDSFISACNNGNVEEAYSYISNDCKSEMFNNIDQFKTLYYDVIFGRNKKNASVENWLLNTYKVDITEDIMATGNANGIRTQDYMTVVEEDNELKLNINSFVGKEELNEEETIQDIKFTIIDKKTYVDYEEYDIQVENMTGNRILLDTQQSTRSIYVQGENETAYYSYSNEILGELLRINNGFSTRLTIKFYKSYSLNNPTTNIVFSDVIFNYNDNISENTERETIIINI